LAARLQHPLIWAVAAAALSAAVIAPAPSYDPWSWLLWGRELTELSLSTEEGPAFKPLPVFVCALLTPLGGWAPEAWVVLARAGAVLAVVLAFRLARDVVAGREPRGAASAPAAGAEAAPRGEGAADGAAPLAGRASVDFLTRGVGNSTLAWRATAAGLVAAVAVALCGGFLGYAAAGAETGWTIAFALAAIAAWRAQRFWAAVLLLAACALLRVEAWPFLLVAGGVLWPRQRALLVACAVAVPALWFVPEWLASGDVLRSGARARVPNPGQPATEAVPALAALREAATLILWPLWAGVIACVMGRAPRARPILLAGLAWIAIVALMAQAGFSGEPRYSLPGGALVALAGAIGLAGLVRGRVAAVIAVVALAAAAAPKLARIDDIHREQRYQYALANDLTRVIGGDRDALLACGRPYVGHLRGPLLAYHLHVHKRLVGFEPAPPGVVFRSRLHPGSAWEPATTGFERYRSADRWELWVRCA